MILCIHSGDRFVRKESGHDMDAWSTRVNASVSCLTTTVDLAGHVLVAVKGSLNNSKCDKRIVER